MNSLKLRMRAIDTLFFRELRPQGGPGGVQLQSVFPPPARTVEGAIRTLLHDMTGTPPSHKNGRTAINTLCMRGPYLTYEINGHYQRLYPWPAHILCHPDGHQAALTPSKTAFETDLGQVFLPQLPNGLKGYRAPQDRWLPASEFFRLLADPQYRPANCFAGEGTLYQREARLGIGRDNLARSASESQLYQTSHIRPAPGLAFELGLQAPCSKVTGNVDSEAEQALTDLQACLSNGAIVRLGSEGRSAHLSVVQKNAADRELAQPLGAQVVLAFTTHADFEADWKPNNFQPWVDATNNLTWRGFADAASGVELEIVSAVNRKYLREGGWDSSEALSRPARALLPAGSVWFCRVLRGDASVLQARQLGVGRELGRGEFALGNWS